MGELFPPVPQIQENLLDTVFYQVGIRGKLPAVIIKPLVVFFVQSGVGLDIAIHNMLKNRIVHFEINDLWNKDTKLSKNKYHPF